MNEDKYKHIHIIGASGSGTTTLAKNLCKHLPYSHLDSDDFFWKKKYSEIQPRDIRLERLHEREYRLYGDAIAPSGERYD